MKSELGEYKASVGSCPLVLHASFSCFLQVLLDWEVECEACEERLRVLVRNLGTMTVVYWVNVSESSGVMEKGP